MLRNAIVGLGILACTALIPPAQAQTHGDRPAYGFACYATPGGITKATVLLRIQTVNKMITVNRGCDSSKPAEIQWPPIFWEDGAIVSIFAELLVYVSNKPGTPYLYEFAPCRQTSHNGYLEMGCIANPNEDTPSGKASFFVSIGPDHAQAIVTRPPGQ
jgi:hypothetical protein